MGIKEKEAGEVYRVSGPVVTAIGIKPRMYDLVRVGSEELMGEVIQIKREKSIIQVYEDTSNIKPGEPVINTKAPLVVELGPGLLKSIYDGVQRPLPELAELQGDYIQRGAYLPGLDRNKEWEFVPTVKKGDTVGPGDVIGKVQETPKFQHRILVPPNVEESTVDSIEEGTFKVDDVVCVLDSGEELMLMHRWPVKEPRPIKGKLAPTVPLITGQRIYDGLFQIAKGGTAAIPGGFGTGKTVTQHQLAKWSDANIVVYVGCGERGNEMTEVLTEFPELEDVKNKQPLMNRTVLIANTSNMPVAAREASVYTGITIAEYFRDMGEDVALMADSTSRWAEAMREISSRLEEMPGEEGYPAYLSSRIASFYERAGRCTSLNGEEGSITVIGAVSPPGGDFSEPMTQNTLRIVKVFWALDSDLAHRRHFPAINWLKSYSLYNNSLQEWFAENVAEDYTEVREWTMRTLQIEAELKDIVQLVGSDALPENQRLTLEVARMIREYWLQQNGYHPIDTYCSPRKLYDMIKAIRTFSDRAEKALSKEALVSELIALDSRSMLAKLKFDEDYEETLKTINARMDEEFSRWEVGQ